MSKQTVSAVKHTGNSVSLVGSEVNFRRHSRKTDMAAVIGTRLDGVKNLIVFLAQGFPAGRVFPNPGLKGFPNHFLLLLGQHGFLGVQHTLFCAVYIVDGVINTAVPQVQAVLNDGVGVFAFRAVGHISKGVVVAVPAFSADIPLAGGSGIPGGDGIAPKTSGGFQKFIDELGVIGRVNPGCADTHINFGSSQFLGLGFFKGRHIDCKSRVTVCGFPCRLQLLSDIAGKVVVRCFPPGQGVAVALFGVLEDDAGEFRRNLAFPPRAVKEFRHKGQIYGRFFPDRNRKGFRRGIHMVNGSLLVDGALKEHIRLALQLSVLVQHFQRTE